MKINKNLSIHASLMDVDDALLGIAMQTGECSGCGQNVYVLRFGLLFGEIYISQHAHK